MISGVPTTGRFGSIFLADPLGRGKFRKSLVGEQTFLSGQISGTSWFQLCGRYGKNSFSLVFPHSYRDLTARKYRPERKIKSLTRHL